MNSFTYGLIHEQDGRYGISFPDFPGCISGGASLDEALARGAETLTFHIEGMIADGDPLPVLRTLEQLRQDAGFLEDAEGAVIAAVPVELPGRAVRVNVSIDEHLLDAIDRAARAAGQSRSAFLASAARARIRSAA
ncbi:MAG: type II toxin-antitoxin system HicB family antitoxin [Rhizobiales bacterium]|nr:type II toxin-antitoxin system HicB family antitoxin [Hyphomicrobiales bacterium]